MVTRRNLMPPTKHETCSHPNLLRLILCHDKIIQRVDHSQDRYVVARAVVRLRAD